VSSTGTCYAALCGSLAALDLTDPREAEETLLRGASILTEAILCEFQCTVWRSSLRKREDPHALEIFGNARPG